jgi:thioredoxin-dependent peroxiredoxin
LLGGRAFQVAQRSAGSGLDQFRVAIFAASCDPAETNKQYAEALRLDFPILSDPEKEVAKAYGVVDAQRALPARYTFYIGADGRVLYIDKAVSAASHGADVAKKLAELGVPKRP